MKHRARLFVVAFVCAACWAAALTEACAQSNVDIYYPLTPRTMTYDCQKKGTGGSITRQVAIQRSRIQDGVEVTPSVVSGDDVKVVTTRFIERTPDGVFLTAMQAGEGPLARYDNRIPILKEQIKKGKLFDSDVKLISADGKFTVKLHYAYSIEDTNQIVKIPYGEFSNCIKIKIESQIGDKTYDVVSWLAPKVGVVKNVEISKSGSPNDTSETTMVLKKIDYSAPVEAAKAPVNLEKKGGPAGNTIANMKGVDFLLLYAAIIAVGSILGWKFIRSSDTTRGETPLPLPSNPDPYEMSYLRGGIQEVMQMTVFKMIQAHSLESSGKSRKIVRAAGAVDLSSMSVMERAVYDELAGPQTMRSLSKLLALRFREYCYPLEQRLSNEGLLTTKVQKDRARLVRIALLLLIFLPGGYKFVVAVSSGHTNVGFLVFMAVIATMVVFMISGTPRLNKRGSDYLKGIQGKYMDAKNAAAADPGIERADLALLVGIFGLSVLRGTPYAQYLGVLTIPDSSISGSDTSSGGGCGGGGGGGCGGCSGGS